MKWEEFAKDHNFREVERSCANCTHGKSLFDGEYDCLHPLLDKGEISCATGSNVCDLWEGE